MSSNRLLQNLPRNELYKLILILAAIITGSIILLLVNLSFIRIIVGSFWVMILPGYLLLKILWPSEKDLEPIWRLSLLLPTSIALIGGVLLLMNYSWAYSFDRAVLLLVLLDVILLIIAFLRSSSQKILNTQGKSLMDYLEKIKDYKPKLAHVILAISFFIFLGSIIFAAYTPRNTYTLTEYYVLNGDGSIPFSVQYQKDGDLDLNLVIANHEGRGMDYRAEIVAKADTGDFNLWSQQVSLTDGTTEGFPVNLTQIPYGTRELVFHLYVADSTNPYRSLRVIVEQ